MTSLDQQPKPTARLADRLAASRRRLFVGRAAEIDLFRAALLADEPPYIVLYLYGPGGVGKTTLLREYARVAVELGVRAVSLDGRNIDPTPDGFLEALGLALGLGAEASSLGMLDQFGRSTLLVDTYETLTPLDAWLREVLLPQLPAQTLVVIAGRNPPVPAWRADLAWRAVTRVVALRNLRPEDSRAYLGALGIPQARHSAALAFTHGHPLALALVADVLAQGERPDSFTPADAPDIVRALLDRFVRQVPSVAHRRALEACAHARVTTEAMLADVLAGEDAAALFAWLRELSFVEVGPHGLFPHDLARDVLDADLRWRNPQAYQDLHCGVRNHIVRRLQAASGPAQQAAFGDLLYLHRHSPIMRPYYEWKTIGSAYGVPAAPSDERLIVELVRRYEGEESAEIACYWLRRQPSAFIIFRGATAQPLGFMCALTLTQKAQGELAADPAIVGIWTFVERHAALRPGEELYIQRFWSGYENYQEAGPTHNLIAMTLGSAWLTNPRLAWSFTIAADAAYWQPMFSYLNFQPAPEAEFAIGGRTYTMFAHDWRAEPALAWLDVMAQRELATDLTVEHLKPAPRAPLIVLSQPEFMAAVRQALRDYGRPAALAASPLLRSRLVLGQASQNATAATLQELVRNAAATLRCNPRDEKLYRTLQHTYFEPAPTQEAAAERLGLPFSTYRRYLANGIERLTEWLWQRELVGLDEESSSESPNLGSN